jgi:transposase-like protein
MSEAKLGQEPAYWTGEVAKKLEISDSTLRKWCIQLEAAGYKFIKGENDSRAFTDHDLKALQLFKQLVKVQRKTKETACLEVVKHYGTRTGTPPMQPAQMAVQAHEFKDKIDDMAQSLEEIKKQLNEQMDFNKKLVERMDQQSMSHIREIQETRKQLAAAEEKKKWWEFWK